MTKKNGLIASTLGTLGVVYGDIGTSPLYAFRESLAAATGEGRAIEPEVVLGLLSLILWALIIIVTLKYVFLLLRADNHGEGGILSLMALAKITAPGKSALITMLGISGVALFYGDALITPAISVLSAVEGLKLITDAFQPYILLIATVIIVLLFIVQHHGTEKVARLSAPFMLLWFVALAAGGLSHIADSPLVWQAINPYHGLHFLTHSGWAGFIALGAVFLSVTGAEALYADLGHFGKKPIRVAWLFLVMPSLMLNYFGQGALVLSHPEAAHDAFFLLYPDWALSGMVLLATLATIIASQAVITGAYSLTHQAIQLGLLPRLKVHFTSSVRIGQIYIPYVNWALLAGVILLIDLFRSSSALASAYGIAVTGTMVITACLAFLVMRYAWLCSLLASAAVILPLLIIDMAFLSANLTKFFDGGFVPILISALLVLMMRVWIKGSRSLHEQAYHENTTLTALIRQLDQTPPQRVEGTAIYLTSSNEFAPSALIQNLRHNNVLHARNFLLTLYFEAVPMLSDTRRVTIEPVNADFTRIGLYFGYMESPHVPEALGLLKSKGIILDIDATTFFISRRNIVPSEAHGMPLWQDYIYIAMANNASDAVDYFCLPLRRVVELGVQMTV
jgi:KUP system potassium uptake protein